MVVAEQVVRHSDSISLLLIDYALKFFHLLHSLRIFLFLALWCQIYVHASYTDM
jgi:hypothetical protein